MRAICSGIDLSDAATRVVKACATKTTNPLLECIRIAARNDKLVLSATDGEISITKSMSAEIDEDGEVCVPGRYFADFVKKLEGMEVSMSCSSDKLRMAYGDSEGNMQVLPAEDFPSIDTDISEDSFVVKTAALRKMIEGSTFCCSTDESRPILKGCQIIVKDGQACITAIDGFRLATLYEDVESATGDMEIICPARTLNEIDRMLPSDDGDTTVYVQKNHMLVSTEDTVVTSRLYTGEFIKKENIIPTSFGTTVNVSRDALKSAVDRAGVWVRSDRNNLVVFDISEGTMKITGTSEVGKASEVVKAAVDGKDLRIAMNSKFITEALGALTDDEIVMGFNSQVQPFVCENTTAHESLYLILPVRITGINA